MLRRVESPPDRTPVTAARPAQPVPRAPRGTGWLCGLFVLTALGPAPAHGADLPTGESAPVEELGPPRAAAGLLSADGVTLRVQPSRRSAAVLARWRLRAPPGRLQLLVPASLRPVTFSTVGPDSRPGAGPSTEVEVDEVLPVADALAPVAEVRIDPASAASYATAPGRSQKGRVAHQLTLEVPASGELVLQVSATLSSGFDRQHWRRTDFEQAHALQKRKDPFVYQFAVRGPAGPVQILAEQDTVASARMVDGVVRAAAAARPPLPLGLTLGLGPAVASPRAARPGEAPPGLLVQGLVRASLEVLLPQRDALALSLEAGSDLQNGHHVGGALVYKLYTPVWPYLPLGGHLDAGVSCDFWQSVGQGLGLPDAPSLRCGPRLGIAAHVAFIGLAPSVDVFPLREPVVGSSETRWTAHYRVAILGTVGL